MGTVIFLIGRSRIRCSFVKFILEDFLEEEFNTLSYGELAEVGRIWLEKDYLFRSRIYEKIEPYLLPYFEKKKYLKSVGGF